MDAGILLRKEASFRFQMHYTPNGKATTVVTRLGLYFYDKPPRHSMQMDIIYDASLTNPDPNKVVHWGDQTWEEMNVGWFRFRDADDGDRATGAFRADDKRADAPAPRQAGTGAGTN
jgi:hypothetical protein